MRVCCKCQSTTTYITKTGKIQWYREDGKPLCSKCNGYRRTKNNPEYFRNYRRTHLVQRREYNKQWKKDHREMYLAQLRNGYKRKIRFLDKRPLLPTPPRKGMCVRCGRTDRTVMHHEKYDYNDPLAYTIEVCIVCHNAVHTELKAQSKTVPILNKPADLVTVEIT